MNLPSEQPDDGCEDRRPRPDLSKLAEPSLWNSKVGRRMFLKTTGAASVVSIMNLHGFQIEVLSSGSGYQMYP